MWVSQEANRLLDLGLTSLVVVELGPTLVTEELAVHALERPEVLHLRTLDTVAVVLLVLVVRGVVL